MRALAIFIAAILALYGLYKLSYPTQSWRQNITITVTTPEGEKTGSSVQSVTWTPNPIFKDGASEHVNMQGEAVAVEVAPGKFLFALLTGPLGPEHMGWVARRLFGAKAADDYAAIRAARGKGPADLPTALIPMLVTFKDINDPKTVERVDPNNLAEAFGQGVRLARASIEITNDPVTTGIEKKIGWLRAVGKERGTLIPNPPRLLKDTTPIQLVSPGDFSSIPAEKAK